MRVLFVDPGKVTGFGVLNTENASEFHGAELGHDDFLDWASHALRDPLAFQPWDGAFVGRLDEVVVEGFNVGPRTIQQCPDDRSMWSVKQIGALEMFCRWHRVTIRRQMPSDKSFGTDAMLKRAGWWNAEPGRAGEAGHRRDAARHALKYAVDRQIIDLRSLLP